MSHEYVSNRPVCHLFLSSTPFGLKTTQRKRDDFALEVSKSVPQRLKPSSAGYLRHG